MSEKSFQIIAVVLFLTLPLIISAQTGTKKTTKRKVKPTVVTKTEPTPQTTPQPEEPVKTPTKKNERPTNGDTEKTIKTEIKPNYFYEFSQPNFVVTNITIEHNETGTGKISFLKKDWDEPDSDPLQISAAALERIKTAFAELDFLNSTENYQYEKDYSHLGNIRIKLKRDGRERETRFNWTSNKGARVLMDEYRKLANQYMWIFDINVARVNQPLDAPKLMDQLDSYLSRNELSDAVQLIPFLRELSRDERIPLIARNHALRSIAQIEKDAKKQMTENR